MSEADRRRAQTLTWLATAEGSELLTRMAAMPADRLTRLSRLRRELAPEEAAVAVELGELRLRARARFPDADTMFFTPEGLEQSTGDRIAEYRAGRFPEGPILDACCGIGGDARRLQSRGDVLAVDRSSAAALCAELNTRRFADRKARRLGVMCADVQSLSLHRLADRGIRAAFFDPSRRRERADGSRRRVRGIEEYSPPLSWVHALRQHFPSVAVKVSPAADDADLCGAGAPVEFISDHGECKEAVIWWGEPAEAQHVPSTAEEPYFATVLRSGSAPAHLGPVSCPVLSHAPLSDFLYEPDPAVIRAHLVPQAAAQLEAAAIEPGVAYLTSPRLTFTPFASAFRVVERLRFRPREIQARLRTLGAHIDSVKKRNVPYDPAAVRRGLNPCGNLSLTLFLVKIGGHVEAILCVRLPRSEAADDSTEE